MNPIFRIFVCFLLIFQAWIPDLLAQCGGPNTLEFNGVQKIYNTACGNVSYQDLVEVSPSGSGDTYRWQVSFSGGAFTDVKIGGVPISTKKLAKGDITDHILVPAGNAPGDYRIRRIVTNSGAGCSNTSQPVFLYYSQNASTTSGGVISGDLIACSPASGTLTVSGNTGPVLRWESKPSSNAAAPWTPITNETNTLTYSGLTSGTCYRALIDNICTGSAGNIDFPADKYSTEFCITVNSTPVITVQPLSQGVCIGAGLNLSVTATSATAMSYQWRKNSFDINGAVSASFSIGSVSNSDAGNYDVVITNSCGTVTSATAVVTVNPTPIASVPSNSVVCPGATIPLTSFSSSPTGATFTWTNSNTAIGLAAASGSGNILPFTATNATTSAITATITVTPILNGCAGPSSSYNITVNPTAVVTVPTILPVCSGATISATNFSSTPAGATYAWTSSGDPIGLPAASGTGNVPSFTAVNAGSTQLSATITVTPSINGCAGTPSSYEIRVNPLPVIDIIDPDDELTCGGNNGSITITATGTGLLYSIDGGVTTQSGGNFTGLAPGSYSVVVSNSSGCTATEIVTISSPGAPAKPIIDSSTNPVCERDDIIVSVLNPLAGATYNWTGPGGFTLLNDPDGILTRNDADISMSGNYVVTVVSAGGCVSEATTFPIVVKRLPTVTVPASLTYCAGAVISASAFISTPPGTTYTWSITGLGPTTSGSGPILDFPAVNNGTSRITATVTVTATLNSCIGDPVPFMIHIDPLPVVDEILEVKVCHGSTVVLPTFTSSVAGATFSWTVTGLGATFSGSGPTIPAFTAVNTGVLPLIGIVTVTANNGSCSDAMSYNVTVNPLPRITNAPLNQITCAGVITDEVVLTSDVNGAIFSWEVVSASPGVSGYPSGIITGNIPAQTLINSGTVQGTVTYRITASANGCPGPATTYVIRVNPLPELLTSIALSQTVCSGSPSAAVNLSSAVAGTKFNWIATSSSPSITGFQDGTGQTQLPSQTLFNAGTSPGTVTYTITPVLGICSGPVSVYTILVNPVPTATISGDATVCYGADALLNVVLTGTAPWTITYSDGTSSFTISGITSNSYSFPVSATSTKTYTIESVSDALCSNSGSGTATITQLPALTATAATSNVTCSGATDGTITISNISGGSGLYQYSINGGGSWQNGNTFSGLAAGTYFVQMRDAVNPACVFTINAGLVLSQPEVLSGTVEFKNVTCRGAADGSITVVNSAGGYGNFEYSKNGGLTWQSSPVFNNLIPGSYHLQIRDLLNPNCQQTLNSNVIIREAADALVSGITGITNIDCFGSSTGAVTLFVRGGVAPYTYAWSNGMTSRDLNNVPAGTYNVTIRDSYNCTAIQTVTIHQPSEPLSINFSKSDVKCFGESNGSISLTVNGGNAPYVYRWSNGRTTKDLTNLAAGSYTVTIVDAKACSLTQEIRMDQPAQALVLSGVKTNVSCFGGTDGVITLNVSGGTAPYSYNWSTGQKTSSLNGIPQGNYSVTVLDANGCSLSQAVNISQPSAPLRVSLTVKGTVCRTSSDGMITAAVSGGTAPYRFSWKDRPQTSNVLTGLAAGLYEVNVTDAMGCTFTAVSEVIAGVCPPVAVDDPFKTYEDAAVSGTAALNDFDRENLALTFSLSAQPKNGTIVFNGNGSFTYTPVSGYWGTETIPYKICNTSGICSTANIVILVIPFTIVHLTPEISNVSEGKKITITARLEKPYKDDAVIRIAYSGVAIKDRDYVLLDQFLRIVIPKGKLVTTQKITVAALTDGIEEGEETLNVQIASTSDPEVRIGRSAIVVIGDIYPPLFSDLVQDSEALPNPDIKTDPLLSPNGDGSGNEAFMIENIVSFPDNEVLIFNRWGNEVFRMKGYNESERVFKGYANTGLLTSTNVPLVDGVYYYLVTTRRTLDGKVITAINKGYLILKR